MLIYGQRNAAWSGHALGWGPALGTIGQYGCLDTDFAMIAKDVGKAVDPASMDDLFTTNQIFVKEPTGTFDLLPDNALDRAYPGEFTTSSITGFAAAQIATAVASPDTYAVLWISTASVPSHFVIAWNTSATSIADPWTGTTGSLAGYGGPGAVHKTLLVKHLSVPVPVVSTKFVIGGNVVINAGPLNVRGAPTISGALLGTQIAGVKGTVIAGPIAADTHNWWNINYATGVNGWSAEEFLDLVTNPLPQPIPPSPLPVAPLRAAYDSTNINDIPLDAPIVFYYVDGSFAVTEAVVRARFPNAILQGISAVGTDAGDWLDVETGDATPDFAPGWVLKRRAALVDAGVYMNESTWAAVKTAFVAAGVPEPPYWVAGWAAGIPPPIPAGAIAFQYANPTFTEAHYDLSEVAVNFPPAPLVPPPAVTMDQVNTAIATAIQKIPVGITMVDVQTAITKALAGLPAAGLTKDQVDAEILLALGNMPQPASVTHHHSVLGIINTGPVIPN
jgi:hypothetical protein